MEAGYEGEDEDESVKVPSSFRWCLTFTPQEDRKQKHQLARAWQDLESQAAAILPKTVWTRALALLRRLTDCGYINWRPDTLELIVDGIEHKGTNLVDLAGHVVQQRSAGPLVHDSPGPPPGFGEFAAVLRCTNARRELVINRRRWPQIYSASSSSSDDDGGDDMEAEDVSTKSEPSDCEKEELWEEEAIESVRIEPSAVTEDDSDRKEDYAKPSCSDKRD